MTKTCVNSQIMLFFEVFIVLCLVVIQIELWQAPVQSPELTRACGNQALPFGGALYARHNESLGNKESNLIKLKHTSK